MPNYQNGKIYSIRSRSRPDLVYIGSTTRPLSERMAGHRRTNTHLCTSKQIIDIGDSYIELIESYSCANAEELNKREGHFQRSMECVNKCIAGRLSAEWYKDNCEHVKSKSEKYRNENKEHVNAKSRQYRIKNQEYIRDREHKYRIENREKLLNRHKVYRTSHKDDYQLYCQLNKEKISKQRTEYYHSKKEIRICICGTKYNYGHKLTRYGHYATQKHQAHIQLIYEKLQSI
jgi:hypothetical protein